MGENSLKGIQFHNFLFLIFIIGLAFVPKARIFVFRFIIEYSSLRDFLSLGK